MFYIIFLTLILNSLACNVHKSCTRCVSNNCNWCLEDNICSKKCQKDVTTILQTPADKTCPSIQLPKTDLPLIYGQNMTVKLNTSNFKYFKSSNSRMELSCKFTLQNYLKWVPATIIENDILKCDPIEFLPNVTRNRNKDKASVNIYWSKGDGKNHKIHPPRSIYLVRTKCEVIAKDLESCTNLRENGCQWCGEKCMNKEDCTDDFRVLNN